MPRDHLRLIISIMDIERGFINMKKKGNLKDTWTSHLCEYNPETRVMKVKSSDGKIVRLEKQITKAWALEATAARRPHRFDVMAVDKSVLAFAGSTSEDTEHWIKVLIASECA